MSMVKFATVCDNPKCLRRSEEYVAFPMCRSCGSHVCDHCVETFTAIEREVTVDGQDVPIVTVQCGQCLEDVGADAHCGPVTHGYQTAAMVGGGR